MNAVVRAIALGLVLTTACGGEVRTGEPGTGDPTHAADGGATSSSGGPDGVVSLPGCEPGTPVSEAVECPFVSEDRCYPEKLAACACACKKASGTVCSSGFPQPGGTTHVTCE